LLLLLRNKQLCDLARAKRTCHLLRLGWRLMCSLPRTGAKYKDAKPRHFAKTADLVRNRTLHRWKHAVRLQLDSDEFTELMLGNMLDGESGCFLPRRFIAKPLQSDPGRKALPSSPPPREAGEALGPSNAYTQGTFGEPAGARQQQGAGNGPLVLGGGGVYSPGMGVSSPGSSPGSSPQPLLTPSGRHSQVKFVNQISGKLENPYLAGREQLFQELEADNRQLSSQGAMNSDQLAQERAADALYAQQGMAASGVGQMGQVDGQTFAGHSYDNLHPDLVRSLGRRPS